MKFSFKLKDENKDFRGFTQEFSRDFTQEFSRDFTQGFSRDFTQGFSRDFAQGFLRGRARGFTLIELMVVIILIAIAGSLVLMNVGQSGRMKQSRMFAGKMVEICRKTRLTALKDGMPACLTISPELRECRIDAMDRLQYMDTDTLNSKKSGAKLSDADLSRAASVSASARGVLTIPESILIEGERIKETDTGLFYICFYPDGSSSGGSLTISVEDTFEFTFQVDMLTGVVRAVVSED